MTKETKWLGPHESPFVAVVKALDANNIDTSEFSTYRMWNMAGEYPFFSRAANFIDDLCTFIRENHDVAIERRADGFYAAYDAQQPEDEHPLKSCPFCSSSLAPMAIAYADADWVNPEESNDGACVICDVGTGGCGTSSGWAVDKDEAVEKWNRRES